MAIAVAFCSGMVAYVREAPPKVGKLSGGLEVLAYSDPIREVVWWRELSLASREGPKEKPAQDYRGQPEIAKVWLPLEDLIETTERRQRGIIAGLYHGLKEISL